MLLRIVKDQSRYVTLRRCCLPRYYVPKKATRQLSAMITDYSRSVSLDEKCDWEALSASIFEIVAEWNCDDDDECYLPPNQIKPSNTKIVNRLHLRICTTCVLA